MKCLLALLSIMTIPISIAPGDDMPMVVDPWHVLQHADSIDIVSITLGERDSRRPDFHGYDELGRVTVTDKSLQANVLSSFSKWNTNLYYNQEQKICFVPRHAIHAVNGDVPVDLLICFECLSHKWIVTVKEPDHLKLLLNETLRGAGVDLAPESIKTDLVESK